MEEDRLQLDKTLFKLWKRTDRLQLDKTLFKLWKRTDFNSTRLFKLWKRTDLNSTRLSSESSKYGRGQTSTRQDSLRTPEEDRFQLDKTLFKLWKRTGFNSARLSSNYGRGQSSTRRRSWSNCQKYSAPTAEKDTPTTRPKTSLLVVKFSVALSPQRPYRLLETRSPGHPPRFSHSSPALL